ncbi:MAG: hypothetical protein U1E62_01465 [Alsobacter sp.]
MSDDHEKPRRRPERRPTAAVLREGEPGADLAARVVPTRAKEKLVGKAVLGYKLPPARAHRGRPGERPQDDDHADDPACFVKDDVPHITLKGQMFALQGNPDFHERLRRRSHRRLRTKLKDPKGFGARRANETSKLAHHRITRGKPNDPDAHDAALITCLMSCAVPAKVMRRVLDACLIGDQMTGLAAFFVACRMAGEPPIRMTAREAGEAWQLFLMERERLGIRTMLPIDLTPEEFAQLSVEKHNAGNRRSKARAKEKRKAEAEADGEILPGPGRPKKHLTPAAKRAADAERKRLARARKKATSE